MSESHIDIRLNVDGPGAADRIAKALAEAIREQRRYPHVCPPHDLDAAWAAAEAAAHPEALIRGGRTGMTGTGWATCYLHGELVATEFGPTFAAALLSLAERLREVK